MRDVRSMVELLGGMARKRQLVRLGAGDLDLTRAVRSGEVHRVRNGWYTVLDERAPAVQAVRVGGRLTGVSAIELLDGWTATTSLIHVSVPRNAARLRGRWNRHRRLDPADPRGVVLHWESPDVSTRGSAVSVGLPDALIRVMLDESEEDALAVLAWAEHTGQFDDFDRVALAGKLPISRRHLVERPASGSESRPESVAHTRLTRLGHRIRTQVHLGAFGLIEGERIDLVVDERVGLEIDGRKFHADTFERDSAKAVSIALMRLLPLRVSAKAVLTDWERVLSAIHELLGNSGVVRPIRRHLRRNPRRVNGRRAASPEFPHSVTARTRPHRR